MSRTYDTLSEQQQKKREVTMSSPSTVPEEWLRDLARIQEAVALNSRPSFLGRICRFRKGDYVVGQEKEEVPIGSRWVCVMGEAVHGLEKWTTVTTEDGSIKKVPERRVGKISEGYQPPPRATLGDMDKSQWKTGLNGKLEDPWKLVAYLPLLSLDGETVMTFTTATPTGLSRFWNLMERYAWIGRRHVGQYPVIELQVGGYDDKRFGWVKTPDFPIIFWVGRPDPARLLGHAGDGGDSDDGSEEGPPPWDIIPEECEDEQV